MNHIRVNMDGWGSFLVERTEKRADDLTDRFANELDRQKAVRLLTTVRKQFPLFDTLENIEKILGSEVADFYARREEGLTRLEQLTDKIIEQNEDYRKRLDIQQEERLARLDTEFLERRKLLEAELDKKSAEIAAKETELAKQRQELDDRSSRHARRALREQLKTALAARNMDPRLSAHTRQTRRPIHCLYVILVGVFGLLAGIAIWEHLHPIEGVNPSWFQLLRVPLAVVAFAAAVVYYIRWSDQWFQKSASEEYRLKRLELDVDRASWLVEMFFEWKDEKGTEIPKDLVNSLSRNLFVTQESAIDEIKHPTQEALSKLLGALSSLQVQIPGLGEATLGRRGLNVLRKAAREDEKRGKNA